MMATRRLRSRQPASFLLTLALTLAMLPLANAAPAAGATCPCTIWASSVTPAVVNAADDSAVELGVRFRPSQDGFVTGIRFYKGDQNTGTHLGNLWTNGGTLLASATFTGETASGWQQVTLASPVAVTAGSTYVASYHTTVGRYSFDNDYFAASGVNNPPLQALQDGQGGPNGVYRYGGSGFPTNTFRSTNYWVDVVFEESTSDTQPPTVTGRTPAPGAAGVAVTANITATFSEPVQPTSVAMELRRPDTTLVPATVTYDGPSRTATLDPTANLATSTTYTASVTGATDLAGNPLAAPVSWSFTTTAPAPPPPHQGPGGPILVVADPSNPFGRYPTEILRAEGLNAFAAADLASVTSATLAGYDVVVLGQTALTAAQVTMFTNWVNGGGNLITLRPDKQLAGLLGLTATTGTLANQYLKVATTSGPGVGITDQTIQFHSTADRYTLNGATTVATLYSSPTAATANPAVSLRSVGTSGGQAAAFTYDLARSVIETRQGNPAWAGRERDGQPPIRSDDLFFSTWVNLNKVAIPQADEQQRLLVNLIEHMNRDRTPLPRFWYFPRGAKAVVVATGDDHANGGTAGRFDRYKANSPAGCAVGNWECLRFSSYIYPNSPLTDAQAAGYQADGFEVGIHVQNGCTNFTPSSLAADYSAQLSQWQQKYTSIPSPVSNRYHCLVWSDWISHAQTELANGMRMDVNYYYWPPSWVGDRPGFFTGSGIPMRFATTNGTMVDAYQATTQMTDESGQSYPFTPDTLLDRALGPLGYYGAFVANMHTDSEVTFQDDALVASARARGVPMVSGRQFLDWVDGRNGSSFGGLAFANNTLSFTVAAGTGANGLTAMVPTAGNGTNLATLSRNGNPVSFTRQTIKGLEYAVFPATPGAYQAGYSAGGGAPQIAATAVQASQGGQAAVTWVTNRAADSTVEFGTSPAVLTRRTADPLPVSAHAVELGGLAPSTTYWYRVASRDPAGNRTASSPAAFTTPPRDTTAPAISAARVEPLPDGTATVRWTTDEGADSRVEFGRSPQLLQSLRVDARAVADHEVVLTELEPATTYWYRVVSRDAAGNPARSRPAQFVTPGPGVADQTDVELVLGQGRGTTLTATGDGELTMARAEEFTRPGLPAGWAAVREAPAGRTEVDRGSLRVDGTRTTGPDRLRPGQALELAATFQAGSDQAAGLAAGQTSDGFALFTTREGRFWASSAGAVGASRRDTPLPGRLLGAPHRYRVDWAANEIVFSVDGQRVAAHPVTVGATMAPVARDSTTGAGVLALNWTRVPPAGRTAGEYTSRVMDAGAMVAWQQATWWAELPAGTALEISVRTGSTRRPDATWTPFRALSGPGAVVGSSSRYLQYRVEFRSGGSGSMPVLRGIGFAHDGRSITAEPSQPG
jgi:Domain of unknown function (DUF4082)/Bacterial Ig-like domain/Purple acid Phosphatase, N-terminal domain